MQMKLSIYHNINRYRQMLPLIMTIYSPISPNPPHFSSCEPRSVLQHVQEGRFPAKRGWGFPWFQSPHTPFWTCSSTESLTYSNIHSVTRGHRGEETEGTAAQLASIKSQNSRNQPHLWTRPKLKTENMQPWNQSETNVWSVVENDPVSSQHEDI